MQRLANIIINELKSQDVISFKAKPEAAYKRAFELIKEDFQKEKDLDEEVMKMMDDLERKNPGEFQRYKMFPLLKKRLAKEKGIVL